MSNDLYKQWINAACLWMSTTKIPTGNFIGGCVNVLGLSW